MLSLSLRFPSYTSTYISPIDAACPAHVILLNLIAITTYTVPSYVTKQ
jgi:hypothetical protein